MEDTNLFYQCHLASYSWECSRACRCYYVRHERQTGSIFGSSYWIFNPDFHVCSSFLRRVIGWMMGEQMGLNFQLFETATLFITVIVVAFFLQEGTSSYLK